MEIQPPRQARWEAYEDRNRLIRCGPQPPAGLHPPHASAACPPARLARLPAVAAPTVAAIWPPPSGRHPAAATLRRTTRPAGWCGPGQKRNARSLPTSSCNTTRRAGTRHKADAAGPHPHGPPGCAAPPAPAATTALCCLRCAAPPLLPGPFAMPTRPFAGWVPAGLPAHRHLPAWPDRGGGGAPVLRHPGLAGAGRGGGGEGWGGAGVGGWVLLGTLQYHLQHHPPRSLVHAHANSTPYPLHPRLPSTVTPAGPHTLTTYIPLAPLITTSPHPTPPEPAPNPTPFQPTPP